MEIQATNNVEIVQPYKEEMKWLLLLMLTSTLLGLLIGLAFVWDQGLYPLPGFGIVGGAIGGIAAGMIQAFSWRISKKFKIVLSISGIVILLSLFTVFMLFVWPILLIPALIIFYITTIICAQLKKSPVNWWLFGFLLIIGIVISVTIVGFLSFFAAGFMAQ